MRTKFMTLALAGAAMLMASCSKEGNNPAAGADKTVNIKLDIPTLTESRGEGSPVADGTQYAFSGGELYFVSASGAIVKHYTISTTLPTNLTTGILKLSDLTAGSGFPITNVPGTSDKVSIIGNVPSSVTLPTAGNLSGVTSTLITAISQGSTSYDVSLVTLYKTAPITGTAPNLVAALDPVPLAGRIELTNLTLKSNSHIASYSVKGIYVNNVYEKCQIDGTKVAAGPLINPGQNATYAMGSGIYTAATNHYLFDEYATPINSVGVNGTVVPQGGTSKVWAYNLLATSGITQVPHILIQITNVVCTDGYTWTGDGWLTIKGFKTKASGTPDVIEFQGGNVYTVAAGDLAFSIDDITPTPETGGMDVTVKVTLGNWKTVNVLPVL